MRLVRMPRLGQDMEEGTVVEWAKSVGDEVGEGEILAVIETDKAEVAFESPAGGYLVAVLADAGSTLATGEPIAWIADDPAAKPSICGVSPRFELRRHRRPTGDTRPRGSATRRTRAEARRTEAGFAPGPAAGKGTGSRSGRRGGYGSGGKGHRG